jgi:hypothetical protein
MFDYQVAAEWFESQVHKRMFHCLKALFQIWNDRNLAGQLALPVFRFHQTKSTLGSWNGATREMSFSWPLLLEGSFWRLEWVLRHEMAHQAAQEIFHAAEPAHGPEFRRACALLEIDHSASLQPQEPSPLAQRIQKLLALAQSDNPHEAELALAKAQELALQHFSWQPESASPFVSKPLHECGRRSALAQSLAALLQEHFGVFCLWIASRRFLDGGSAHVLEISGMPQDVEVAEFVWVYLNREVARLWRAYRMAHPRADRRSYHLGLLAGFRQRLANERQSNTSQTQAQAALVPLRNAALASFVKARHGGFSRGRGLTYGNNADFQAGSREGRAIELRPRLAQGKVIGALTP